MRPDPWKKERTRRYLAKQQTKGKIGIYKPKLIEKDPTFTFQQLSISSDEVDDVSDDFDIEHDDQLSNITNNNIAHAHNLIKTEGVCDSVDVIDTILDSRKILNGLQDVSILEEAHHFDTSSWLVTVQYFQLSNDFQDQQFILNQQDFMQANIDIYAPNDTNQDYTCLLYTSRCV